MPPAIEERIAPRAALYEALPDFMVRMQQVQHRPAHEGTWLNVTATTGDYKFTRSTIGSRYEAERTLIEAGVQRRLTRVLALRAALHHGRPHAEHRWIRHALQAWRRQGLQDWAAGTQCRGVGKRRTEHQLLGVCGKPQRANTLNFNNTNLLGQKRFLLHFFLSLLLMLYAATAQSADVCSDTPGADDRIVCAEGTGSSSNIVINLTGQTISTSGEDEPGISASHEGTGDIYVITSTGSISTTGTDSNVIEATHTGSSGNVYITTVGSILSSLNGGGTRVVTSSPGEVYVALSGGSISSVKTGIFVLHENTAGTGDITIDVMGLEETDTITTTGPVNSDGIFAQHLGGGDIDINLQRHTKISTSGPGSSDTMGVDAWHQGTDEGNIDIDLVGGSITTSGDGSNAIRARRADHGTSGNIRIYLQDSTISTTSANTFNHAINADNKASGEGEVSILLRDTTVTTGLGIGIQGKRSNGSGDIILDVDGSSIMTNGANSNAIYGEHSGTGKIDVDISGSTLGTNGPSSTVVNTSHSGTGNVEIDLLDGTTLTARGDSAYGISVPHYGAGDVDVNVLGGSAITVHGIFANGIFIDHSFHEPLGTGAINVVLDGGSSVTSYQDAAINVASYTDGRIAIDLRGRSSITTKGGTFSHALNVWHLGENDIDIDLTDVDITTESTASPDFTFATGVRARHDGTGDIELDAHKGTVSTAGAFSYGLYGDHNGTGQVTINTYPEHMVTTTGPDAHGIVAYQRSTTADPRVIKINAGGKIDVSGTRSQGIRVGTVNADGVPQRIGTLDEDGYPRHTVTLTGTIASAAEGIYLAGGGRVIFGPQSSIDSESGIAVLATGTVPADNSDPNNVIAAIPPRLRVDFNLDGLRTVADVLNDGWIINDGGPTYIFINGVEMHNRNTGATGNTAANGVWDVTLRSDEILVTDRTTDPWTFSTHSTPTIMGRDFSANDFTETQSRCPTGHSGSPPNCMAPLPMMEEGMEMEMELETPVTDDEMKPETMMPPVEQPPVVEQPPPVIPEIPGPVDPEPETPATPVAPDPEPMDPEPVPPVIVEQYAPRAALYEALPDFMMRMQHRHIPRIERNVPVWIRVKGTTGDYEFDRSTIGSHYDAERLAIEAGVQYDLSDTLVMRTSLHHRQSRADVSAPTLGGVLRARGMGVSFDFDWQGERHYALGSVSISEYDLHIDSDTRGRLKSGADAEGYVMRLEAGSEEHWAPRAWLTRRAVSIDSFRDAVGARVSFSDERRWGAGFGIRPHFGTFHTSLDIEHSLQDVDTRTVVSGHTLNTRGSDTRLKLGLGRAFEIGPLVLNAEVSAKEELYTGSSEYAGSLSVQMH